MIEWIVLALALAVCTATLAWVIGTLLKDSSIADVFWGIHFIVISAGLLLVKSEFTAVTVVVTGMVAVWGLRLAFHIGKRKVGKPEDWRYQRYREEWGASYPIRNFVQNFLFQGLLAVLIALPVIAILYSAPSSYEWWQIVGVGIWLIGFSFEVISDAQLAAFLRQPKRSKIMTTGLWKYSRHPNYFGEITQWWGIWVICITLPYWVIAAVGPLLITFLITKVSGVPLLEKKFATVPGYKAYADKTSWLVPLPPKKEKR